MLIRESGDFEITAPDDTVAVLPFLGGLVRNWSGVAGAMVGAGSERKGVPYGAWFYDSRTMLLRLSLLRRACRGVFGSPEWVADNAEALGVLMHESGHAAHTRREVQEQIAARFVAMTGRSLEECMNVVTLIEEPRIEALQIARIGSRWAARRYGDSDFSSASLAQSFLLAMSTNLLMADVIKLTEEEKSEFRQALRLAVLIAGRGLYFRNPEANTADVVALDHRHLANIECIRAIFEWEDWLIIERFITRYNYRWAWTVSEDDQEVIGQFLDLWFRRSEETPGDMPQPPEGPGEPCDNPPPNPGENGKPGEEPGDEGDEPGGKGEGGTPGTPGDGSGGSEGGSEGSGEAPGGEVPKPMGEMGKKVRRAIEELTPREMFGGRGDGGDGDTIADAEEDVERIRDEIRSQVEIRHEAAKETWKQVRLDARRTHIEWLD